MGLEENTGNCHIQVRSKDSSLTINHIAQTKKKSQLRLILLVSMSQVQCAACVCALMQVLLLPVGRGIAGPCFTCGAHNWDVMIGGPVPVRCDL